MDKMQNVFTINAPFSKLGVGHVVIMRVVEQSFAGNAAYIEAGTTQGGILLDTHSLHAELGCLDGCHITARSRPNDDQISIGSISEPPTLQELAA